MRLELALALMPSCLTKYLIIARRDGLPQVWGMEFSLGHALTSTPLALPPPSSRDQYGPASMHVSAPPPAWGTHWVGGVGQ